MHGYSYPLSLFACLPAIKPLNNLAQKSILLRLSLENVTKMVTVS